MAPAEITTTADGTILHRKDCSACSGSGEIVYTDCQHWGLCDCSVTAGACDTCGGDGVVLLDDCDCSQCDAAYAALEGRVA